VKQLLAQQALDIVGFKNGAIEKPGRLQGGREDIKIFRGAARWPERHACGALEVLRATSVAQHATTHHRNLQLKSNPSALTCSREITTQS
jgi:hypothetical protein